MSAIEHAIVERLGRVPLDDAAADHLLAAVTDGGGLRPSGSGEDLPSAGAYLKSVTVAGFRGIGPASRIDIKPGPGLTVVCGRNGSGKSSFAEALEVLLTGDVRRLRTRSQVWRSSWRCLHGDGPSEVSAELVMEGIKGTAIVTCRWDEDARKIEDGQVRIKIPGEPDSRIDRLGWGKAMDLYRPFLSHAELEVVLDKPSELYDQLSAILGLGELADIAARLAVARKASDATANTPKTLLAGLVPELERCPDPRAAEAVKLMTGKNVDLDAIESLATGSAEAPDSTLVTLGRLRSLNVPLHEEVVEVQGQLLDAADRLEAAGTSSVRLAQSTADLLAAAVDHYGVHGPGDCPVCGRAGALTNTWLDETRTRIDDLRAQASEMDRAQAAGHRATQRAQEVVTRPPDVLREAATVGLDAARAEEAWARWAAIEPAADRVASLRAAAAHLGTNHPDLAAAVDDLVAAASAEYVRRQDLWSPLAVRIGAWCTAEQEAMTARLRSKAIKKAEGWLKAAAHDLRNERLQPYVQGAAHIWSQLRQESNVDLVKISLEGVATSRSVDFDVTVDGQQAAGLGVMSQGEVNALALSVFLPRATADDSPCGSSSSTTRCRPWTRARSKGWPGSSLRWPRPAR